MFDRPSRATAVQLLHFRNNGALTSGVTSRATAVATQYSYIYGATICGVYLDFRPQNVASDILWKCQMSSSLYVTQMEHATSRGAVTFPRVVTPHRYST